MRAFISYSHNDEAAKDALKKHLTVLRDEGAIDDWHDREILPGEVIDDAISEQLESRALFLAMVSPDFLDSDYIKHKEMGRALERYDSGEMLVVPIIVEPCDWQNTALGRLMALPRDGQAISLWDNQNEAFVDVTNGLRRLIEARAGQGGRDDQPAVAANAPAIRVQRDFDEIDRADFRDECFQSIRDQFRDSAAQLDAMDGFRCRFHDRGATSFTCTLLNQRKEHGKSDITIHATDEARGIGDISYSHSANAPANTANGWLTVESDGYELRLKMNQFGFGGEDQYVTAQSAAEILWKDFAARAGIEYA